MAGNIDSIMLERQIGKQAAAKLKTAFKRAIKNAVDVSDDGEAKNATVTTKYKSGRLDRLTFVAADYIYKQNFGFEGTKKNGITMRLNATDVLQKAINESNVLEDLADQITDLRGESVIAEINLGNNGR